MPDSMVELVETLLGASYFEEAATQTLSQMLKLCAERLAQSQYEGVARILRGMVHLRPADGYRRLVTLEWGQKEMPAAENGKPHLPSATAWRWVAERGAAVAIDVNLGEAKPIGGGASVNMRERTPVLGVMDNPKSQQRLLRRDATHVLCLPLRSPRAGIDGMISLEAECRAAIAEPFIWTDCAASLQLLADIASPYFGNLPLRPVAAAATDELLPVVGESMAGLVRMLRIFAEQEETLLISGPTGSGKSRLAHWCHEHSLRRGRPFESLDLSTVPAELQLGELFGWKKGAFTGAVADNLGAIARAQGGTLFIDEIDKLSLRAQAGLLHVLEERTYRTLGDSAGERRASLRFVVGTNSDLQAAVRRQQFREDLFYRINVLPVKLPPLNKRADEIVPWARYMLNRRHRERVSDGSAQLDSKGELRLQQQPWPGNLRQLDNIIRRAYTLAMMEYGVNLPRELEIDDSHLARALAYESGVDESSVVSALHRAAMAFVCEAERAMAKGSPLDLDSADSFKGFLLGAAADKLGDIDSVFRLFDRQNLIRNRNHHKVMRRELQRAKALCNALGSEFNSSFSDASTPIEEDEESP